MTLMSFKSSAMYTRYTTSRERRCGIFIVSFAISGVLMTALLLCNGIGRHMQYNTNNSNIMQLESNNNTNNNNNKAQLKSNIQIMLLTNELSTTPNVSNSNQKSNNKNINNSSNQQHYKINVAADENLHTNSMAIRGNNNTNLLVSLPHDMNHQNRFVDEINIGNQHGVFNGRLTAINSTTAITTTAAGRPVTAFTMLATGKSLNAADAHTKSDATSNTNVHDLMENEYMRKAEKQQTQELQSNSEVVLHRQKRYLIFPEGSSFQLVFDVIIGIVGYTSYAILGITCAVAWELPSKPPSELIENLHDKITEGFYTTSESKPPPPPAPAMRRNDSIAPYFDSFGGGGVSSGYTKYGSIDAEGIKYVDSANMLAPTHSNYENMPPSQVVVVTAAPSLQNAMETAYYTHERQSSPFGAPINTYNAYKKVVPVDTRYYTTDGAYQPANFYANARYNNLNNHRKYYNLPYKYGVLDKNVKSSYYDDNDRQHKSNNNKHKNPFSYSAHGDATDKQQAAKHSNRWQKQQHQQQRHQQPQHKKWQSWQDYDGNWRSYQQHQQKLKQAKWATQSKYVGTNNWWSRNKQHVEDIWRTKQNDLRQDNVRIPESRAQPRKPVMTYSPPAESLASADATFSAKKETAKGRNFDDVPRLLLAKRPKAKIYPIFGRRRRRSQRSSNIDAKLDAFELKLERIHLREQLRTRQKLYGKIEKLYETRGLNGTACVLRALCETGQKQQQKQHADKTEPQSFITELLRAIFTLPTISINSAGEAVKFEEAALHPTDLHIIDRTYRDAQGQHDSCAQLFTACEHSLWD